jgi:hypothetical protein
MDDRWPGASTRRERARGADGSKKGSAARKAADPLALMSPPDAQRLFEGLLRYVPEGIAIAASPDATIVAVSDYAETATGRGRGELVGKPAAEHPVQWRCTIPTAAGSPSRMSCR